MFFNYGWIIVGSVRSVSGPRSDFRLIETRAGIRELRELLCNPLVSCFHTRGSLDFIVEDAEQKFSQGDVLLPC
jgi:hypothetical protein